MVEVTAQSLPHDAKEKPPGDPERRFCDCCLRPILSHDLLLLVDLQFAGLRWRMGQRSYVRQWSCLGQNWPPRNLKVGRRPLLRRQSLAESWEDRALVHALLALRWDRFVANPRRCGCP